MHCPVGSPFPFLPPVLSHPSVLLLSASCLLLAFSLRYESSLVLTRVKNVAVRYRHPPSPLPPSPSFPSRPRPVINHHPGFETCPCANTDLEWEIVILNKGDLSRTVYGASRDAIYISSFLFTRDRIMRQLNGTIAYRAIEADRDN